MLKKILSNSTCAQCQLCCVFDRYDIWETPLFTPEQKAHVLEIAPEAEFAKKGSGFVLNCGAITNDQLFSCPALSDHGCTLGSDKPFDCQIWPFRIMNCDGELVIAVSSLCTAVYEQSHDFLKNYLTESGLAERIFSYGEKFPEAVHPLYDNYTILLRQ